MYFQGLVKTLSLERGVQLLPRPSTVATAQSPE